MRESSLDHGVRDEAAAVVALVDNQRVLRRLAVEELLQHPVAGTGGVRQVEVADAPTGELDRPARHPAAHPVEVAQVALAGDRAAR